MPSPLTVLTVPTGPYLGYTLVTGSNSGFNLEDALTALQTQRAALQASLIGGSVNGQSFQFSEPQKTKALLDQQQSDLELAFAYLDPGRFPVNPGTNTTAVTFR